jgi:hypothetical protein
MAETEFLKKKEPSHSKVQFFGGHRSWFTEVFGVIIAKQQICIGCQTAAVSASSAASAVVYCTEAVFLNF